MRNENLQGAVLATVAFLCGLFVFIADVRGIGFANLSLWKKVAVPVGLGAGLYLCWLMWKAYRETRRKAP
jgi:hypothetical protein